MRCSPALLFFAAAGCTPAGTPTGSPSPPPAVIAATPAGPTAPPPQTLAPSLPAAVPTAAQPPAPAPKADAPKPPTPAEVPPSKTLPIDLTNPTGFGLSPDGGTVGVPGKGKWPEGAEEHLTVFYDLATGKRVGPPMVLSGPGAMSDKARTTAFFDFQIGKDSDIVVREVATGKQQVVAHILNGLEHYDYSPDGKLIVTGRKAGLGFWNAPDGTAKFPLVAPSGGPILAMSRIYKNGTRVATLHDGVKIAIWDLTTGKLADELSLNRAKVADERVEIAPDGQIMIVYDEKNEYAVWDLEAKKRLVWENPPKLSRLRPMTGRRVAWTDSESKFIPPIGQPGSEWVSKYFVAVADADTGRVRQRLMFPGQKEFEAWREVATSHDGKRAVSLSLEKRLLYVWDLPEK